MLGRSKVRVRRKVIPWSSRLGVKLTTSPQERKLRNIRMDTRRIILGDNYGEVIGKWVISCHLACARGIKTINYL
jgi:hypothetical protein